MGGRTSLSSKFNRIGGALLVVTLVSIGFTLWVTRQLEGGAAAVNEAGRLRMIAWRLASAAQADGPPETLQTLAGRFESGLRLLHEGDSRRPLKMPAGEAVSQAFATVTATWAAQRPAWLAAPRAATALDMAEELAAGIDRQVTAMERQLLRLTAVLDLFQVAIMVLAVIGAAVMLYIGHLLVIDPLRRLGRGLRAVESGDFAARVDVDVHDELGQVAAGFNHMAATLQSLYGGLEAQVAVKTRRIEAQRARLAALYEVSDFLAGAGNLEEMSGGFARRVRGVVGADAVAIRWTDEASQRYLMLASDCFPAGMAADERSLPAGACACGNLQPDARTRIIPIADASQGTTRRCAREGYQCLVSVPIRLQQRPIGEMDLFFRTTVMLGSEDIALLEALAGHLASAMEGLRAAALEREAAVGEERALLARELHDSIAQSLVFLKIQVQLLRTATRKGQAAQVQSALDELDTGLRESIADVRELLVHFRTRTRAVDFEAALQETLQKFQHQTGLAARMRVTGEGLPLPADVQIQVLNVVQEALSNVRKHAAAGSVDLEVAKGPRWRITVRDDGGGFDVERTRPPLHVGLRIMRERAARIGADLQVVSRPGQGTSVDLVLPVHPVAVAAAPPPDPELPGPPLPGSPLSGPPLSGSLPQPARAGGTALLEVAS